MTEPTISLEAVAGWKPEVNGLERPLEAEDEHVDYAELRLERPWYTHGLSRLAFVSGGVLLTALSLLAFLGIGGSGFGAIRSVQTPPLDPKEQELHQLRQELQDAKGRLATISQSYELRTLPTALSTKPPSAQSGSSPRPAPAGAVSEAASTPRPLYRPAVSTAWRQPVYRSSAAINEQRIVAQVVAQLRPQLARSQPPRPAPTPQQTQSFWAEGRTDPLNGTVEPSTDAPTLSVAMGQRATAVLESPLLWGSGNQGVALVRLTNALGPIPANTLLAAQPLSNGGNLVTLQVVRASLDGRQVSVPAGLVVTAPNGQPLRARQQGGRRGGIQLGNLLMRVGVGALRPNTSISSFGTTVTNNSTLRNAASELLQGLIPPQSVSEASQPAYQLPVGTQAEVQALQDVALARTGVEDR
jgi:hypothetical protein